MLNSAHLDHAFAALSDPTRRTMLARLSRGPAAVSELAQPLRMSLPAVLQHLQALGVDRIETATALIVVRKSPPAVKIIDEALIPDAFIRVVKSVDRSLLRTALLKEQEIPGARLTHGSHLWMR